MSPRESLQRCAQRIGLKPIVLTTEQPRKPGRPKGSLDSYDRVVAKRDSIEQHAALMRERYGAIEDYEREAWGDR